MARGEVTYWPLPPPWGLGLSAGPGGGGAARTVKAMVAAANLGAINGACGSWPSGGGGRQTFNFSTDELLKYADKYRKPLDAKT